MERTPNALDLGGEERNGPPPAPKNLQFHRLSDCFPPRCDPAHSAIRRDALAQPAFPHPPPVGVTISTTSPASTFVCAQPGRISTRPSLRRMELRPSSPGSPPIEPGLGTA